MRKAEAANSVSPSGGQQLGIVGFGPSTVELRQKEESRQAYAAALRQQLVDNESRKSSEASEARVRKAAAAARDQGLADAEEAGSPQRLPAAEDVLAAEARRAYAAELLQQAEQERGRRRARELSGLGDAVQLADAMRFGPSAAEVRQKEDSQREHQDALRRQVEENERRRHARGSQVRAESKPRVPDGGGDLQRLGPSTLDRSQAAELKRAHGEALRRQADEEKRSRRARDSELSGLAGDGRQPGSLLAIGPSTGDLRLVDESRRAHGAALRQQLEDERRRHMGHADLSPSPSGASPSRAPGPGAADADDDRPFSHLLELRQEEARAKRVYGEELRQQAEEATRRRLNDSMCVKPYTRRAPATQRAPAPVAEPAGPTPEEEEALAKRAYGEELRQQVEEATRRRLNDSMCVKPYMRRAPAAQRAPAPIAEPAGPTPEEERRQSKLNYGEELRRQAQADQRRREAGAFTKKVQWTDPRYGTVYAGEDAAPERAEVGPPSPSQRAYAVQEPPGPTPEEERELAKRAYGEELRRQAEEDQRRRQAETYTRKVQWVDPRYVDHAAAPAVAEQGLGGYSVDPGPSMEERALEEYEARRAYGAELQQQAQEAQERRRLQELSYQHAVHEEAARMAAEEPVYLSPKATSMQVAREYGVAAPSAARAELAHLAPRHLGIAAQASRPLLGLQELGLQEPVYSPKAMPVQAPRPELDEPVYLSPKATSMQVARELGTRASRPLLGQGDSPVTGRPTLLGHAAAQGLGLNMRPQQDAALRFAAGVETPKAQPGLLPYY